MNLFETGRLAARRLIYGDEDAMLAIYGDPEATRFVGDGHPLDWDACHYWIDVTDGNFNRRGYGMVAFVAKDRGEIIACAGIVHPNQQTQAEVKYALRRDEWGKGFATEAVRGLVDHARANWDVTDLIATVYPDNLASQNVLRKAGFVHEEDRKNEDGSVTSVWESRQA